MKHVSLKLSRHPSQQGFTLVEIMIAATVSLIMLSGVMHIFLGSKKSYNLQNGMSRMQENARYAADILARNITMAGYTSGAAPIKAFIQANTLENSSENSELGFTTAAGTASDTIEINFEASSDCLGNATGGNTQNRYYIQDSNLMCLGSGNGTPGVLAEGIENMQVLYGQDTDNDGIANRYVNASNIVVVNPVVNVRIGFLANTVQGVDIIDTATYSILNTPPIGPMQDTLMRRVYTQTILLRNNATF